MPAETERDHALKLFAVLRNRVLTRQPPINGYHRAAEAIGLDGARYSKHMGQVCSRMDVATFNAGYPMLATHMVRKPNGRIPSTAFRGIWQQFREECINTAQEHVWTPEQLDAVLVALNALRDVGARGLWKAIQDHEADDIGYIRRTLHGKLNSKRSHQQTR